MANLRVSNKGYPERMRPERECSRKIKEGIGLRFRSLLILRKEKIVKNVSC